MLQSDITRDYPYNNATGWGRLPASSKTAKEHLSSPVPTPLHVNDLSCSAREKIAEKLSFLEPVEKYIHSLVVVGSAAYGIQGPDSDIDLVIITTTGGHEKVCELLFEKEIEESLDRGGKTEFECTILSSGDTKKLFQASSPFAYSIRYGAILRDDGYLLLLRGGRYPLLPQKEYYRTCLFEKILTPYYTALREFRRQNVAKDSSACRLNRRIGRGLSPAEMFAQVIVCMLYVTLPSRGMMPLTKNDIVSYAQRAYGTDAEKLASRILDIVRGNAPMSYADECRRLKNFAVQLFKEILHLVIIDHDVRIMIADAAKIAGKTYDSIRNSAMKNCVV
ncbi:MAG: nucleotidyltransferase domain-containing protein [Desulfobulbaceae bacterium]|nr:nucleotidyltransferase domain-containing protein [Desulfobulbaceae bacterium]